ncbi:MAG: hypothetical protein J5J06_13895 [Phycisphaerae bacterium]|nr:hypothetical protein [Phycisphaerae bacterium]
MKANNTRHSGNGCSQPGHPQDTLQLPGLDGSNPLGFLAALGLLRVLAESRDHRAVFMHWVEGPGTWVPEISIHPAGELSEDDVLDHLSESLAARLSDHPAQLLERFKRAGDAVEERQKIFRDVYSQCDRLDHGTMHANWLAALASDAAPADAINQLQTARRDYYLKNIASVIERTTRDHLQRAIFRPWDYADALDNQSLHLDPGEDRRHAHQWNQPSGDPDRKRSGGMLGANRLAIEAIPLFTSMPENDAMRTIGFTGNRSHDTRWTWPIWSVPIPLSVVRSMLVIAELQQSSPGPTDVASLRARGIVAGFRTRRILVNKTPNFTPAQRIA